MLSVEVKMPNKRVGLDQASFGRVASAHDPTELHHVLGGNLGYQVLEKASANAVNLYQSGGVSTDPNYTPPPRKPTLDVRATVVGSESAKVTPELVRPQEQTSSTPADATAVAYKPPIGGNPGNSFAPRPTIDQDNSDSPFSPQNKEKVINRTKELYPGPQQSSAGPVAIK
jgi:hypothetical protein